MKTHPACFAGTPLSRGEFFTSKFCINSPLYQEGIQGCVRLSILNPLREIHKRPEIFEFKLVGTRRAVSLRFFDDCNFFICEAVQFVDQAVYLVVGGLDTALKHGFILGEFC